MEKKKIWIKAALLAAGCAVFVLQTRPAVEASSNREREALEYVLYIGLNDKDTYQQLIPTREAKEMIHNVCVRYVDGYTVTEAEGAWVDEMGRLTTEHTLVYSFRNAGEEDICQIMDEVLEALNQNTILMEERGTTWSYYNGEEEYEAEEKYD